MLRQSLTILLSALLVSVTAIPQAQGAKERAQPETFEVEANTVKFDPDTERLVGMGDVKLNAGGLTVRGDLLFLDLEGESALLLNPLFVYRGGLEARGSRLIMGFDTKAFILEDPELRIGSGGATPIKAAGSVAECFDGGCRITDATATACTHRPAGYLIKAKEVEFHKSGDFTLRRPVLEVDGVPVAAAPWLRLRTGNAAGFLPPRLGWDAEGGLVAGPSGRFPLGDEAFAQGHVAIRTAQGLETRTAVYTDGFSLTVDHLFDAPDNLFRLESTPSLPLIGAALNADIDLITDRQIIDDMASHPMDRATTHTSSRGLLAMSTDALLIETSARLLQSLDASNQLSGEAVTPSVSVDVQIPPLPFLEFLWPTASARFTRFGISSPELLEDASGFAAPGHSRLEAEYGFFAPARVGPLALGLTAAGRHQAWLPDSTVDATYWAHLASAEARVALPLARRFQNSYHKVEPFVRYRVTPLLEGRFPSWTVDDFDRLKRGHGMEAGLSTSLIANGRVTIFDIDLWERISLPGFGAKAGFDYLAWTVTAGPDRLALSVDGSLDHERETLSTAGVALKSRHERSSIELGGRWVGAGAGPHLDQPFATATGPWIASRWPRFFGEQLEIFENLKVRLSRRIAAHTGARVGAWPDKSLHALWYGLELRSSCGCLAAQITASHRLDTAVPDVMTVFVFEGF